MATPGLWVAVSSSGLNLLTPSRPNTKLRRFELHDHLLHGAVAEQAGRQHLGGPRIWALLPISDNTNNAAVGRLILDAAGSQKFVRFVRLQRRRHKQRAVCGQNWCLLDYAD